MLFNRVMIETNNNIIFKRKIMFGNDHLHFFIKSVNL